MSRAEPPRGELGAGLLPTRLATGAAGAQSGRLVVEAEPAGFELYFAVGRLIGARDESGQGFEASLPGVDAASLAAGVRRARLSGRRLSVELAEAGALGGDAVRSAVEAHAVAVLGRGLRARRGHWRFEAGLDRIPADAEIHLEVSAARVLIAASRSVTDEAALKFHLGDLDRVVALAPGSEARAMDAALSPVEGFVMARVTGQPTLSEVLTEAGSGLDAKQALLGLLCAGIVRVTDRPPRRRPSPEQEAFGRELLNLWGRLASLSHFELLDVPVDVTPAALRDAWARLAVRYHPDRHMDPALADLAPRAGAVLARMSEAFQVLSDPARREAYTRASVGTARARPTASPDATLPPSPPMPASRPGVGAGTAPRPAGVTPAQAATSAPAPPPAASSPPPAASSRPPAEANLSPEAIYEQLSEARRLYRERRYWDALQMGESLLRQAEGWRLRERLHVLCARCRAENPLWRHEAEEGLRTALEEIPQSAEIHYELARLYRRVGLEQRANAELRAALDCDPGHEAALKELAGSRETPPGRLQGLRDRLAAGREPAAS